MLLATGSQRQVSCIDAISIHRGEKFETRRRQGMRSHIEDDKRITSSRVKCHLPLSLQEGTRKFRETTRSGQGYRPVITQNLVHQPVASRQCREQVEGIVAIYAGFIALPTSSRQPRANDVHRCAFRASVAVVPWSSSVLAVHP